MRGLTFRWLVCVILLCMVASFAAEEAGKEVPLTLVVELIDGSRIVGSSPLKIVPIHNEAYGKINVRLETIETLVFAEDRKTVQVSFHNGDQVSGALKLSSLEVKTSIGKFTIAMEHVVRLSIFASTRLRLAKGLIAHYSFRGNANDRSDRQNHGTVLGATLVRDRFGTPDNAYLLDGIDDHIDISKIADDISRSENTIALWLKPAEHLDATAAPQVLFANWQRHYISYERGRILCCVGVSESWGSESAVSYVKPSCDVELVRDRWYHIALTFKSGDKVALYLDGKKLTEQAETTSLGIAYYEHAFDLGRMRDNQGPRCYFKGALDDVRIYNRALPELEIRDLYRRESTTPEPLGQDQ